MRVRWLVKCSRKKRVRPNPADDPIESIDLALSLDADDPRVTVVNIGPQTIHFDTGQILVTLNSMKGSVPVGQIANPPANTDRNIGHEWRLPVRRISEYDTPEIFCEHADNRPNEITFRAEGTTVTIDRQALLRLLDSLKATLEGYFAATNLAQATAIANATDSVTVPTLPGGGINVTVPVDLNTTIGGLTGGLSL